MPGLAGGKNHVARLIRGGAVVQSSRRVRRALDLCSWAEPDASCMRSPLDWNAALLVDDVTTHVPCVVRHEAYCMWRGTCL